MTFLEAAFAGIVINIIFFLATLVVFTVLSIIQTLKQPLSIFISEETNKIILEIKESRNKLPFSKKYHFSSWFLFLPFLYVLSFLHMTYLTWALKGPIEAMNYIIKKELFRINTELELLE